VHGHAQLVAHELELAEVCVGIQNLSTRRNAFLRVGLGVGVHNRGDTDTVVVGNVITDTDVGLLNNGLLALERLLFVSPSSECKRIDDSECTREC
jgi:hypothetical protein